MDTNTQMTICLAIIYIVFILWGTSKKSGVTSVNATPETDCGINYFPSVDDEDEEEEFNIESSSSSTQVELEVQIEMETDCATVGVMVVDPWTIETNVVPVSIELEFNQCRLEYQLALPPAKEVVTEQRRSDVIVAKPIANESHVDYDKAEHHLMLSLMTLRQLKAEAKRVKLPKYGSMKKAELLFALKSFNTNA